MENEWHLCLTLLAACCFVGLMLPASRLYDWEMELFRKWGWNDFATGWEKRKSWWIPMARAIMGILGLACLIAMHMIKNT